MSHRAHEHIGRSPDPHTSTDSQSDEEESEAHGAAEAPMSDEQLAEILSRKRIRWAACAMSWRYFCSVCKGRWSECNSISIRWCTGHVIRWNDVVQAEACLLHIWPHHCAPIMPHPEQGIPKLHTGEGEASAHVLMKQVLFFLPALPQVRILLCTARSTTQA